MCFILFIHLTDMCLWSSRCWLSNKNAKGVNSLCIQQICTSWKKQSDFHNSFTYAILMIWCALCLCMWCACVRACVCFACTQVSVGCSYHVEAIAGHHVFSSVTFCLFPWVRVSYWTRNLLFSVKEAGEPASRIHASPPQSAGSTHV